MKTIAIYPGRFQPFGKHHAATYLWVQNKFGKNDSYIATSDIVDPFQNPFSFNEKKAIISAYGFGNKVIKTKNPYKAEEITKKFDPDNTAVVFIVGEKDLSRLNVGAGYFLKYPGSGKPLKPLSEHGYVLIAPHVSLNVPGYGEMSGTQIRKALGDTSKSRTEKKKLFSDVFGWYSPKMATFIFDVLEKMYKSQMNETKLFDTQWWADKLKSFQPLSEEPCWKGYKQIGMKKKGDRTVPNCVLVKEDILNEGGAAGHMLHPFDLPNVKTGKDLLRVFTDAVKSLQSNPAAVKIDGINTTLKIVKKNGKVQFALDRGSMNPLDVEGITVDDLGGRFPEGHGMLTIGKKVLDAFNACLPNIKSELNALGMLKDPTLLLNVETVIGDTSGKANVIAYKENFFVIHGLLKSEQVTPKRRAQHEVSSSPKTIESMVNKCKPTMKKMGFGIYGIIPTTVKKNITFTEPINTSITVMYNKKRKETKSLKEWLAAAKNPKDETVIINGKKEPAMSKKNYLMVLNQTTPLDDLTKDPKDQKKIVDGAIMWHATRLLGNAVLKNLGSEVGDVEKHEGIVIRDPKISKTPFKIVGEFIVQGLESSFGK